MKIQRSPQRKKKAEKEMSFGQLKATFPVGRKKRGEFEFAGSERREATAKRGAKKRNK